MDKSRSSVSVFIGLFAGDTLRSMSPHPSWLGSVLTAFAAYFLAAAIEHYRSKLENEGEISWKVGHRG